jgi:molybdate transport system permease protein
VTGEDWEILGITLATALGATALIFAPGILAALWLSRSKASWRVLAETLFSLPLVLPPTAVGLVLLSLLAKDAVLGRWLDALGVGVVFTWKAVVLATAVMSFPLLVRSARTAFGEVDPRLLAVARTLGDGPVRAFFRVQLPLAWRGVAAGTLLAFSRALGEFGATILVAGNIPGRTQTLSLAIFHRAQIGQDSAAFRLVGLTAGLAFLAVGASELATRSRLAGVRTRHG